MTTTAPCLYACLWRSTILAAASGCTGAIAALFLQIAYPRSDCLMFTLLCHVCPAPIHARGGGAPRGGGLWSRRPPGPPRRRRAPPRCWPAVSAPAPAASKACVHPRRALTNVLSWLRQGWVRGSWRLQHEVWRESRLLERLQKHAVCSKNPQQSGAGEPSSNTRCTHFVLCSTSLSHSRCRSVLEDRDMLARRCAVPAQPGAGMLEGCAMQHLSAATLVQRQASTSERGALVEVELMHQAYAGPHPRVRDRRLTGLTRSSGWCQTASVAVYTAASDSRARRMCLNCPEHDA